MDPGKIKKSLYFAFISLVSLPSSLAAITDDGGGGFGGIGGGGVGNSGVEASLVEFANTILLFQVDSAAGVLLYFVAPMAGFYFVQKNMLSYGFELFEERIDRHTYGRTDDDVPNGIKGLSIVTGFITVQMLGVFGASFLLVTGLLSILLAFLMQFGLLEGALDWGGDGGDRRGGGNGNNGGNNNNGGGGGGGQQNQGGGGNVDWNQVGQAAGNIANNFTQAQQNRNNRSIQEALEVFDSGTDVPSLIDKEPSDFRNHVTEIENESRNSAEDLDSLESVLDRMENIEQKMEDMQQYATDDIQHSNDWPNSKLRNQFEDWETTNTDVPGILRKIREDLERIKNNEKNTSSALQDQLDKSWDDIQVYIKIHEFSQKLPRDAATVAGRDRLLSELAEEARNRNLAGGRSQQQAKRDFRDALEKLGQYETAHQNLLERLESELSKELKIDQTDGEELNRISTQDKAIISAAENVDQLLGQIPSGSGGSPSQNEVETQLRAIKNTGEAIDNEIQDIYSIIQSEGKFENKSYKKLKDLA